MFIVVKKSSFTHPYVIPIYLLTEIIFLVHLIVVYQFFLKTFGFINLIFIRSFY